MTTAPDPLEDLLAEALDVFDRDGEQGLSTFLAAHEPQRQALERGLQRCRQMGLLGTQPSARDFPDRLGEFRLLRRLGSGGMGVVYEAEQQSLHRRVALKVVRPELLYFEGARERFLREIEAVARLSHPSIVPVLASGEQDGLPWYAMELLDGNSVHEVCTRLAGRNPADLNASDLRQVLAATAQTGTDLFAGSWWQLATRIVHAIALGVRHAHLRGIVHRDIKPSNVMLTTDGRAVLLDFGIARIQGGVEFTRTGNTPGSPGFMSPEQLRGTAVDERTDVYSLAATLWQLLTLAPPFAGVDDLQRIQHGDLPDLRSQNHQVPRELALVVMTAMDRDRERRYADVGAFADDLLAVLQRRPIRARRLGPPLRALRWCQRHRVAATTIVLLLVTGLLLPVVFAWRERSVNRDLQQAVTAAERSLTTTLDAISSLLVRVGAEQLRYLPEAEQMAIESLGEACSMYRELLPDHARHLRMHVDAGKAMERYADTLVRAGRAEQAVDVLREAIGWLGGESDAVPDAWRNTRLVAWINLGSTWNAIGNTAEAERSFDRAEHDLDQLAGKPEFERLHARGTLQLCIERANLLSVADDPRVEPLRRRAVELAREQLQRYADDPGRPHTLVMRLDALATLLVHQRRANEALPLLEEALLIARAIPDAAVTWPPTRLLVADVLETLGTLHVQRGDQRAVAALKECLTLREAAAATHPANVEIRSDLGGALHNLAWMNFYQQQYDLALERLERALALQRSVLADMPRFRQGRDYLRNHLVLRGRCLARLMRLDALQANAEQIGALLEDPMAQRAAASQWLMLARALGNATPPPADLDARRSAHADRAMAHLLAAERAGWGTGNRLDDKLYDMLRERSEFRSLAERVTARQPAGAPPPSTSNASREMPR